MVLLNYALNVVSFTILFECLMKMFEYWRARVSWGNVQMSRCEWIVSLSVKVCSTYPCSVGWMSGVVLMIKLYFMTLFIVAACKHVLHAAYWYFYLLYHDLPPIYLQYRFCDIVDDVNIICILMIIEGCWLLRNIPDCFTM